MGNSSNNKKENYNLPCNNELNSQIKSQLGIAVKKDELERFKKVMNKKMQKDFKRSNFSEKFIEDNKTFSNISSLINLIYTKSTNTNLKRHTNRTLYESVYNYDIIERDSKSYDKFNKKVINSVRAIVEGDESNNNLENTLRLSEEIGTNYQKKGDISQSEHISTLDKASLSQIRKVTNNDDIENEYINKDMEAIKKGTKSKSSLEDVLNVNSENSQKRKEEKRGENEKRMTNESVEINFDNNENNNNNTTTQNLSYSKRGNQLQNQTKTIKGISQGKKKHKKTTNKKPIVNIKIDLKDLVKQEVYETSVLDPRERYKKTKGKDAIDEFYGSREIFGEINNLTSLKTDVNQTNINDGSFLELVDSLVQPNKKAKDRIHSRTPKKKGKMFQTNKTGNSNLSLYKTKVMNAKKYN